MIQLFKMAFRNLGRNRLRTIFSALAVALALMLLMLVAGVIRGEIEDSLDLAIHLQTGHIQVRSVNYNENKTSLKWDALVENPDQVAAQIATLEPVKVATPRLFASGFVSVGNESTGARIYGIDPLSEANAPYRDGIISGDFLTPDDRQGVLIGKPMAEKLSLKAGDQLSLSVNTSNGDIGEQSFTVRGIYTTNTNSFDSAIVFLPLAKAQAIVQAENHASTIFVLLKNLDQTQAVADALAKSNPNYQILTWSKMNDLLVQLENTANSYMGLIYLIVLAISATVIVNTLIMSVFERTREIGILVAIGMKGRRVMAVFLAETSLIALGGILIGLILGLLVVPNFGVYIGNMGLTGITMGNTLHAKLNLGDAVNLSIMAFVVTVLAGLYPAILAARLEPVEALRAEK